MTSYGSQGKTVDHVLLGDAGVRGATNSQRWYFTISRGRRGVHIFTPDKAELRAHITRSGYRALAIDLEAATRKRRAIQRGMFHTLRRGRAFARAVALMFARKRFTQEKQTVSVRASNNRPKNQQAHALRRNRTNTSAGVANAIAPASKSMSRLTKRSCFRINTFSMRSTRERVSDETLRLSFGTHEVVIPGRNLSEIATALQDLAVEQISAVPPRYRELPHDEGAWIRQIEIRLTE